VEPYPKQRTITTLGPKAGIQETQPQVRTLLRTKCCGTASPRLSAEDSPCAPFLSAPTPWHSALYLLKWVSVEPPRSVQPCPTCRVVPASPGSSGSKR